MDLGQKCNQFQLPCNFPQFIINVFKMVPLRVILLLAFIFPASILYGQDGSDMLLFTDYTPLPIHLSLSIKEVRKKTNDSTYLDSRFHYYDSSGEMQTLKTKFRKRGNFRLRTCYYPPLKLKINKREVANTPFSKNRKFKLVSACFRDDNANDLVIKELIAYKLYEKVSPYYFKTRLLDIDFEELRTKKAKRKQLKGFLIEDIDDVAERLGAEVHKRKVHPLEQDARVSIINSFFQCMIGNTDYSTGYQHNEKLVFKDGESYPIPYDFDMSGLVNAPYATVSKIQGKQLPIEKVTQRLYRGFVRDRNQIFRVRELFLEQQEELLAVFDTFQPYFEHPSEFKKSKDYVSGFFKILEDGDRFENMILDNLRIKMAPIDTITPK